jgi:hypothetical protein
MNRRPTPPPTNMAAMAAAHADPVAFAREVAIYNEQLRLAGFAPMYDTIDHTEQSAERGLFD